MDFWMVPRPRDMGVKCETFYAKMVPPIVFFEGRAETTFFHPVIMVKMHFLNAAKNAPTAKIAPVASMMIC
jgi:hypothetical protein